MKHVQFASAVGLAVIVSSAHAQSGAPKGAAPSSVASESEGGLTEIIVTAQRTEQSAQKAPIAISVIQPDVLTSENIVRSEDLSRAVPALVAANQRRC